MADLRSGNELPSLRWKSRHLIRRHPSSPACPPQPNRPLARPSARALQPTRPFALSPVLLTYARPPARPPGRLPACLFIRSLTNSPT